MRFYRLFSFLVLCLAGLGLWACKNPEPEIVSTETRLGYDFFPLETGRFVEYLVQQTQYSLVAPPVLSTYQLREVVKEPVNLSSGPGFRLERYRRNSAAQAWRLDSVWVSRRELSRAVRTENNVAYVKLLFPVSEGLRWNGNALNAFGPDEYELRRLNNPLVLNGLAFDSTLTVVQQADSSLVSLERRLEQYARRTGLIYKEFTQFYYCNTPDCLGKGKIDFGVQTLQRITRYGKE